MKLYYWLYPGLRIKRWLLAFAGGLYLVTLGWAMVIDAALWARMEIFLKRVLYAATGRFLPSPPTCWGGSWWRPVPPWRWRPSTS